MKNNQILFFIFFLLISINKANEAPTNNKITLIPNANHNATTAFVSLEDMKESKYLYFSFDFNYHYQIGKKVEKNNLVLFKIITEKNIYNNISYTFLDKDVEKVSTADLEQKNNIFWKQSLLTLVQLSNEKSQLLRIYRFKEYINKNTLIIKIPISKYKGEITIENINYIPNKVLEIIKDNKNNNYYPNYKDEYNNRYRNKNERNHYYDNFYNINHQDYYKYRYNSSYSIEWGAIISSILGAIWIFIFILYCLINRRKSNQLAIIIGNNPQYK